MPKIFQHRAQLLLILFAIVFFSNFLSSKAAGSVALPTSSVSFSTGYDYGSGRKIFDMNTTFSSNSGDMYYGYWLSTVPSGNYCTQLQSIDGGNTLIPTDYWLDDNTGTPDGTFSNPSGCSWTNPTSTPHLIVFKIPNSNVIGGTNYGFGNVTTGHDYGLLISNDISINVWVANASATTIGTQVLYSCVDTSVSAVFDCLYRRGGGGGGGTAPTITFKYPNNTSTVPPFSPWIVKGENLTTTTTYTVSIHWFRDAGCTDKTGNTIVDIIFQYSHCGIYSGVFSDQSDPFIGTTTRYIYIPRSDRNLFYQNDAQTQDNWHAWAYLYDTTNQIVATSTIDFTLLRYAGHYDPTLGGTSNGTSTYERPIITASGTLQIQTTTNPFTVTYNASSTDCTNDTFGFCAMWNYITKPSTNYTEAIQGEMAITKTRFPISLVYTFVKSVSTSIQNATSEYQTLPITFPAYAGQPTTTIDLLPTNLWTQNPQAGEVKNQIFPIIEKFLWLATAAGSIAIIFL